MFCSSVLPKGVSLDGKRYYSSSIDNDSIGKTFTFIANVIDDYKKISASGNVSFNGFLRNTQNSELKYEREKLNYSSLQEIIDVERISFLKYNIQNFYFDGKLYLKKNEILDIFTSNNIKKVLRIIYSYAEDRYGFFQELLFDKILKQSGYRQLFYNAWDDQATGYMHKYAIDLSADFGDRVLTAKGEGNYDALAGCVRNFVRDLSDKIYSQNKDVSSSLDELLNERLNKCDFSDSNNIKWYIVKYEEFFYSEKGTTLSVLRRKNYGSIDIDNIYDIQCLCEENDFNNKVHWHPFYLALSHKLNNDNIKIDATLKYVGTEIEYKHPCKLSNGWQVRIKDDGNWIIKTNGTIPNNHAYNLNSNNNANEWILDCAGKDSIEEMAGFLNSL